MFVRDLVDPSARQPTVTAEECLAVALAAMTWANDGFVFVRDAGNRLVGLLTDGDVRRLTNQGVSLETPVGDVMNKAPLSLGFNATVVEAFSVMTQRTINVLPILAADGTLHHSVTLHQVLSVLSPERIYLTDLADDDDDNHRRHLSRYRFASHFLMKDFRVLDCACGAGYGSRVLAETATSVLGVDRSNEAIEFARLHHGLPTTEFLCRDIGDLDFPKASFDAVVTLETFEHLAPPVAEDLLSRVAEWIKPGGILVLSSPMLRFRDGRPFVTNPYHINELPRAELIATMERHLQGFAIYYFHQKETVFLPLGEEHEGFCIVLARKVAA